MSAKKSANDRAGAPPAGEAAAMSPMWMRQSYPSQGLTPERLALIFKEADHGDVSRQSELFEEMEEKDAHLASVLQTRKLAVARLAWEVAPASAAGRDLNISSFVERAVRGIDDIAGAFTGMLDAVGKGFSVSELMWDVSDKGALITAIKWRHPAMFIFDANDGSMQLLTDAEPVRGEGLAPNKFVVHIYAARGGFAPRGGVLRPCAYMYLFKNYTVKDWAIFNERYAMPMRVGRFNASTPEADRRVLKNAVFNMGADAAAVISDSTVIELLESSGKTASAETYERMVDFCDRSMSKAVLGQTLTTEQTQGTYATARVHARVRQDILEADARALEHTVNSQVLRPLVLFNFGPEAAVPSFRFRYEEDGDLKGLADTYASLVGMGFDGIPKSHLHARFGIPRPEQGEETVRPS